MSPLCSAIASCFPRGDQLTKKLSGNDAIFLGYELTSARSRFGCPARIPTTDRLEGSRVQNLNRGIVTFSKNGNKIGHVSRIWFNLLTGEISGEGMNRRDFVGAGGEDLGAIINGNRAMSKSYEEFGVVASEGEEVWGSRDRERSLRLKRDFFNTGWRA